MKKKRKELQAEIDKLTSINKHWFDTAMGAHSKIDSLEFWYPIIVVAGTGLGILFGWATS